MQSEDFDKKVNEAANNHHPAYDENAWAGMEKLLDQHLPQKKDDRRRIIFFLWLLLLLGAGAGLFIFQPWKGNKPVAQTNPMVPPSSFVQSSGNNKPADNSAAKQDEINKVSKDDEVNKVDKLNAGANKSEDAAVMKNKGNSNTVSNSVTTNTSSAEKNTTSAYDEKEKMQEVSMSVRNGDIKKSTNHKTGVNDKIKDQDKKLPVINTKEENQTAIPDALVKTPNNNGVKINDPAKGKEPKSNSTTPVITTIDTNSMAKTAPSPDKEQVTVKDSVAAIAKLKSKKSNSFFITVSAGPDVSFAGSDQLGKMKLLAGIGLGYTFKDRLTIRSGFYKAQKIYSASPYEYHAPAAFYTYYPYLEKVDANCKVYEIPVTLSYNFGHSTTHNWFASTGLSSYLMKTETYNYFYKTSATGPTMSHERIINDENRHFFSVLTVSGGYKRNINQSLSFMIEPYLKLPLSGVGYGKVKLNSSGVLLSLAIKPFGITKK